MVALKWQSSIDSTSIGTCSIKAHSFNTIFRISIGKLATSNTECSLKSWKLLIIFFTFQQIKWQENPIKLPKYLCQLLAVVNVINMRKEVLSLCKLPLEAGSALRGARGPGPLLLTIHITNILLNYYFFNQ